MKITHGFFQNENVVDLARQLLGKVIVTNFGGAITSGIISETEAYAGSIDKASHAFGNRRTKRTETLFQSGGIAYVYLCYGIHHLFNFVSSKEGIPHAVLLRGIYPLDGIAEMESRVNKKFINYRFADGPGKLTRSLGISTKHDGLNLEHDQIWVEDRGWQVTDDMVCIGPRIGVDYAGEDALLPYRFLIKPEIWTKKNLP